MAEEQIKITVGADTSQFQAAVSKADQQLKSFQKTTAQSGYAITNLSRVVQDAPYGFIGIANNLNPLIDSFVLLRKESGTTGGAFKSLSSSLTGPAGIGLAFAAITTAITFAQIGFSRWTQTTKEAKEKLDDWTKSQINFNKSLDSAQSSALSTAVSLQQYVNIAKNGELPLRQRNEALKEANKILGEHGDKLTLVNINTQKTTDQVNLFTKALINQAIATKYADRIAELTIQQTKLTTDKAKAEKDYTDAKLKSDKENINSNRFTRSDVLYTSQTTQDALSKTAEAYKKNASIGNELKRVTSEITRFQSELTTSTNAASSAFGELGTKTKDTDKKTKKATETIDQIIAKMNEDLKDAINVGIALDEPSLKERISIISEAIKKLVSEKNVAPDAQLLVPIKSELNELQFIQNAKDNFKTAELAVKKFNPQITVPVLPKIEIPPIAIPQNLVDFGEELKSFMVNIFSDLASTIGQGIANVITGASSFKDLFNSILSVIGDGIKGFGQQLIKMGVLALLAKKAIQNALSNPALLIAAGAALVMFGTLLTSTQKKQAFAVGTNYAPGGMALVGERGPELINLPRGSQVVPAAQTSNIMKGASQQVEVYGVLRGQDIYFSNKKYSQTYKRTT